MDLPSAMFTFYTVQYVEPCWIRICMCVFTNQSIWVEISYFLEAVGSKACFWSLVCQEHLRPRQWRIESTSLYILLYWSCALETWARAATSRISASFTTTPTALYGSSPVSSNTLPHLMLCMLHTVEGQFFRVISPGHSRQWSCMKLHIPWCNAMQAAHDERATSPWLLPHCHSCQWSRLKQHTPGSRDTLLENATQSLTLLCYASCIW